MKIPRERFQAQMPESPRGFVSLDDAIETAQGTMLDAARTTAGSIGRAGQKTQAGAAPTPVFATPVAFDWLQDLVPSSQSKVAVALDAPDYKSASMSLTTGYIDSRQSEQINPQGGVETFGDIGTPPWRTHRLWVEYGVGASRFEMEIDVAQGNACTITGAMCRVALVDWTFNRRLSDYTYERCSTEVGVSQWPASGPAVVTTRVCAWYNVNLNIAAPPPIDTFYFQLAFALRNRTILV